VFSTLSGDSGSGIDREKEALTLDNGEAEGGRAPVDRGKKAARAAALARAGDPIYASPGHAAILLDSVPRARAPRGRFELGAR
jgi:hypothetical protein